MHRITNKHLECKIERLNEIMGTPIEPYTTTGKAGTPSYKISANMGNYHLSGAYGGVSLCQMAKGGGTYDTLRCGHIPKRELAERIDAYIAGIIAHKEMESNE